jgi:His/Glu/Gln/Arg/opine family amino acid ABC transporter permease subunit
MTTNIWPELIHWTPSLATGFGLNLSISFVAMLLGTLIGWLIAHGRASSLQKISISSNRLTDVFRNIPSFVFMFYIAFIIPIEFEWQGEQYRFPAWIKASIALTVPVVGFASDQFYRLIRESTQDNTIALPMFFISWTQYFLIILMASSTASVIGVHEIVGRANTAIAVTQDPNMMLWIYLYVAAWFLLSATIKNGLLKWLSDYLKNHYTEKGKSANNQSLT